MEIINELMASVSTLIYSTEEKKHPRVQVFANVA